MRQPSAQAFSFGESNRVDITDEEVVRQVLAGSTACFEILMRRYNQRLFRVVRGILSSDEETEDVLQEAYVNAFEHLAQFAGRASFSTWLTRIAVHEAFARLRRQQRMLPMDFSTVDNQSLLTDEQLPDVLLQASNHELGQLLAQAIATLPRELRVVFTLRMVEGLDTHETAACLELSESNVKVRLHRARALLRKQIDATIGVTARRLFEFDGERCDRIVHAVLSRLTTY